MLRFKLRKVSVILLIISSLITLFILMTVPFSISPGTIKYTFQPLKLVDIQRDLDAHEVIVASTRDTYIEDQTVATLENKFHSRIGGVWCGGAANYHAYKLHQLGFETATLSFGFKENQNLTHAVTLVNIRDKWHISDAYFNLRWNVTKNSILKNKDILETFEYFERDLIRTSTFLTKPDVNSTSWVIGRENTFPLECDFVNGLYACQTDHDLKDFLSKWGMEDTYVSLEAQGYPREFQYLILFPYALNYNNQYHKVESLEEVFDILNS